MQTARRGCVNESLRAALKHTKRISLRTVATTAKRISQRSAWRDVPRTAAGPRSRLRFQSACVRRRRKRRRKAMFYRVFDDAPPPPRWSWTVEMTIRPRIAARVSTGRSLRHRTAARVISPDGLAAYVRVPLHERWRCLRVAGTPPIVSTRIEVMHRPSGPHSDMREVLARAPACGKLMCSAAIRRVAGHGIRARR